MAVVKRTKDDVLDYVNAIFQDDQYKMYIHKL